MLGVEYHNDFGISNSDLGLLKESPWMFRQVKDRKVERITADYLALGTLIHLAVLQPDLFSVADIEKPSGLLGKFLDLYVEAGSNAEAAKYAYEKSGYKLPFKTVMKKLEENDIIEYLEFIKTSAGKVVLTRNQKYVIDNAQRGIERNPEASKMLFDKVSDSYDEFNEQSLFGVLDGVRLKGQPDRVVIDHTNKKILLIDLKSTSSAPYFRITKVHNTGNLLIDYYGTGFFGSFKSYAYYRQLAYYKTLVAENFKQYFDKYTFECYIAAVNTTSSFDCALIKVSDTWLNFGRTEFEELLFSYKEHQKENQWEYPIIHSQKGVINLL